MNQAAESSSILAELRTEPTEHADKALRTSELSYRRLFETAQDGILILDAETGRVNDVNPFLIKLLGFTRSEMVGKTVGELSPFKDIMSNQAMLALLQRERYVRYHELPLETKTGRKVDVEFISNVYQVGDAQVIQCNIREITDRKRAEEALRTAQQFLGEVVNAIPVRVFWKDKNLAYLGCNRAFARDAGFAGPKDILGKDDCQMVWREQAEAYRSDDRQVIASGQSKLVFEETQTTPEGKTITVLSSKLPLRDAKDEIIGVLGTYMDITERKLVQESHARLAMAVEQAAETVVITDAQGTILYANPAFEKTSGYTRAEVLGQNPRMLKSGKQDAEFYARMWEVLQRGEIWRSHFTNKRKDGTLYEEEVSISPVRNAAGMVVNFVAVKRDVTREVQLETQFRQSQKIAEEVLQKVSQKETDRKRTGILLDLITIFGLGTLTFAVLKYTNYLQTPFNKFIFNYRNDLDEVFGTLAVLLFGFFLFSYRRWREVKSRVGKQASIEVTLRVLHDELEKRIEQRTAELTKSNDALLAEIAGRKKMELERQKLEEQFRQSQKMEAFGQLAGGVAHDFNNILAVIQLQAGLLKSEQNLSAQQLDFAGEIEIAAQRAANLTRQLLLFSRKQTMQPRNLNLKDLMDNMTRMLQRTLGEQNELQFKFAKETLLINADPGMIDQILLNLTVNARDAMPDGGQIIIETSAVEFDEVTATQTAHVRPGLFVCLSVSDTGCGIPQEILPQIFEPFFTTKEVGKGTGLGLATVFGIVQQHKGWINVYSEVGRGTAFRIYLPRLTKPSDTEFFLSPPAAIRGGKETILLVEDELPVRASLRIVLSRLGYRVLEATTGAAALAVCEQHLDEIRLLLTDLVMPGGMNGKALAEQLLQQNPKIKVIYTSGYSVEVAGKDLLLEDGVNFLAKPFQTDKLAQTIRHRLDQN